MRTDRLSFVTDNPQDYVIGEQYKHNGFPIIINNIEKSDKETPKPSIISAFYGRKNGDLIEGLTCSELATTPENLDGGHMWVNATSLYSKDYLLYCRYCGEMVDTEIPVTKMDREQGLVEIKRNRG